MVGVNPPGRFVWEADQLHTILVHEFSRLCAQDAWCCMRTPDLSRAHQVIFRDAGHANLMEFQGSALGSLVGGFFATGAVDTTGFHYAPMTFRVKWKLSRMVKLSLLGGEIFLGGLVFAGFKLAPG